MAIKQNTDNTDQQGGRKNRRSKNIVLLPQRITADGWGDHAGDPRKKRDQHPVTDPYIGQTNKVTQKIFWRTGNQKYYKQQQVQPFTVLQKPQRQNLFPAKKLSTDNS